MAMTSVLRPLLLLLVVASAALTRVSAEHWAVIVAGSRGYDNYRHQADACHAYHVVRRHGIPEENVILMMYDDVANHKDNPFPGQLFNKPANSSDATPVDVYRGCNVEYRGDDVTPEMFVNVLLGNAHATGGKRVLESTASDRVFVNFVDHGARGLVVFPHGEELSSKTLNRALKQMFAAKRYKELVFYMEACESGSMFSNRFLSKINAFATTAANGLESSWGTYCPPLDFVNGKELGTCLGDLYSVNWMEDSDLTDLADESVNEQFQRVKRATNRSHVHAFGSKTIPREIVGNFQSNYDKGDASHEDDSNSEPHNRDAAAAQKASSAVNAHDVDLVLAFYRYLRASPGRDRSQLADAFIARVQAREQDDALFAHIRELYAAKMNGPLMQQSEPQNDECREQAFKSFEMQCSGVGGRHTGDADIGRGFTSYSLQYAGVLSDLCESPLTANQIDALLREACSSTAIKSSRHATRMESSASSEGRKDSNNAVFDPELSLWQH